MKRVVTAPIRSLDDFLLEGARLQFIGFKDPEPLVNRIINNLLYYQTNYLLVFIINFILVGIAHPVQIVLAFSAVVTAFVGILYVYVTNNKPESRRFKIYPGVCAAIVMFAGYVLVYILSSVAVFMFGIALPVLVCLLHAMLRMRNIKNKINRHVELIGVERTPMGVLLEYLGHEQEAGS